MDRMDDSDPPLPSTSENPPPLPSSLAPSPARPPSPPSLDAVEQLLLTLLTSSSALLSQLSSIQPSSPPSAVPHAQSFLSSLAALKGGLMWALNHGTSERTYRRSAYGERVALDVECEAAERISERLEGLQLWAEQWRERQQQRPPLAGGGADDIAEQSTDPRDEGA